MRKFLPIFVLLLSSSLISQETKGSYLNQVAEKYTQASFSQLIELLSIPNDAHFPEDIERNVQWCEGAFSERSFKTERIPTPTAPLLLASREGFNAEKTVLVYLQIDGQPVDSSRWFQESPWVPVFKRKDDQGKWVIMDDYDLTNYDDEWRIFARAASDAKGPVSMFLAALDAIKELKIEPNYNLKVIMDFEEELGSPNLPAAVSANREMLAADMLIIFDGPLHISNQPTIKFGARGISTVTITTYGPVVPQHSGHYGNYAPNPALRLSKLLGSMKDDEGRVIIPGFYDGIKIDEETKRILDAVPDDETMIMEKLQIAETDKVGGNYQEAIQYPSLNIRGLQSGWIDEDVRTIIPAWARAEIDIRLVLESDPKRLIALVKDHIKEQGYHILEEMPNKEQRLKYPKIATFNAEVSYQSFRTDFDSEVGIWLKKALNSAHGKDPIMVRMTGGSIPIAPFVNTLNIPAATVPTVNMDNNQHSPNENLRLGNYREGIKTMIAILSEKL